MKEQIKNDMQNGIIGMKNKNTTSCQTHNQYCCMEYTNGSYEHNANDTNNIQFIRTNADGKSDKNKK